MTKQEQHIEDVTTLAETRSQAMAGHSHAVGMAALVLLIRAIFPEAADDLPISFRILRELMPTLLHELEPDEDDALHAPQPDRVQ